MLPSTGASNTQYYIIVAYISVWDIKIESD